MKLSNGDVINIYDDKSIEINGENINLDIYIDEAVKNLYRTQIDILRGIAPIGSGDTVLRNSLNTICYTVNTSFDNSLAIITNSGKVLVKTFTDEDLQKLGVTSLNFDSYLSSDENEFEDITIHVNRQATTAKDAIEITKKPSVSKEMTIDSSKAINKIWEESGISFDKFYDFLDNYDIGTNKLLITIKDNALIQISRLNDDSISLESFDKKQVPALIRILGKIKDDNNISEVKMKDLAESLYNYLENEETKNCVIKIR
jgi:hypothetical protein